MTTGAGLIESSLADRVVLVTGGAGAIGAATARTLAAAGARIVVVDRDGAAAHAVAGSLPTAAIGVGADIAIEAQVDAALEAGVEEFGVVDGYFLNAGVIGAPVGLPELSLEQWSSVIDVNVTGTFLGVRSAVRDLVARGVGGSIVVTSSIAGIRASDDLFAYTVSKHAIVGMVRAAAAFGGPHGIRVNAIAPGVVPSPINGPDGVADMARRARSAPLRRPGSPDDVAATVAFLLSDASSYLTGDVISIDGGAAVLNATRPSGGAGQWDVDAYDARRSSRAG